ncbi:YchJ family metal-binding protein [Roseibium salinum]|nr:YchJ family metal-binding protein [Roseibium salinum]
MAADLCCCGSGRTFDQCCGPFLDGLAVPETAEALMRSRYSAYVRQRISYLKDTLWPKHQDGFDPAATARWAAEKPLGRPDRAEKPKKGGEGEREGTVLFEAKYLSGGRLTTHRELSRFRKKRPGAGTTSKRSRNSGAKRGCPAPADGGDSRDRTKLRSEGRQPSTSATRGTTTGTWNRLSVVVGNGNKFGIDANVFPLCSYL